MALFQEACKAVGRVCGKRNVVCTQPSEKKNLGNVIDENLARIVPLYDIDIILS